MRRWRFPAAVALVSVLIAVVVVRGFIVPAFALLAIGAALALAIHNWRWAVYGLLLYLPVSGIIVVLTYSTTNLAVLIKDFVFVIPAYAGFYLAARQRGWRVPGAPIVAIGALAFLVLVESFRPSLPNPLVALIGMKVWLFYIPLLFLGYHFIESRDNLQAALGVMTAIAMVPATIGIVEAIAIYGGHADQVYSFYGSAAASVTQQFTQQDYLGGGFSRRIPSTFSFETQYFTFVVSMLAVVYAWWRLSKHWVRGAAAFSVLLVAGFTTGARGAFLMIPFLVVLIVFFEGRLRRGALAMLAVASTLLATVALFGANPIAVLSRAFEIGLSETQGNLLTDAKTAFEHASLGLGTGYSTLSTRYALVGQIDARYVSEAWWAKVILELGVVGLAAVVILFAQLVGRAYRAHRRMADPGLRAFSAAMIAFLVWNMVYFTKGSYIDVDPINVYFWLFAGMLLRAGHLGGEVSVARASATIRMNRAVMPRAGRQSA
jgi:hypothetical protein